jgi:dTDP-4-amino-4,6-dideoxygalactose transaminase
VLSFGGSKLLTAGRGGAVLTDRGDVLQRIKVYCERGNNAYPLSELQAAVLIPQLARLAERNRIRHANASRLRQLCQELDGLLPLVSDAGAGQSSFYKLAWLYQPERLGGCAREQFLAAVRAEGVGMDEGFRGFALRSTRRCRKVGDLPHSQEAAEATVLLHHPVLLGAPDQIDRVSLAIRKVLAHFGQHPSLVRER